MAVPCIRLTPLYLPQSRHQVRRASALKEWKDEEIEASVLFTPIFNLSLLVLGSFRRCLSNSKFQFILRGVYVLSTILISNTIAKMVLGSYYNELFPIWAVFLIKFHGGTDSISVYSIEGNGSAQTLYWILLGLLCSVFRLFLKYHTFWLPVSLISGLTAFKTWERVGALNSSSNGGLAKEMKVIADFMEYEHELSITDFITDGQELESEGESATMAAYNYLVQFEESKVQLDPVSYLKIFEDKKEVVTVGKIWQCKGQLLRTEEGGWPLQDLCLSFALFKLLRCRFAEYPMPERAKSKLSQLVLSRSEDDYERTFKVIEGELAFLFDSFYTKYPTIFRKGLPVRKVVQHLAFIAGCCIAGFLLRYYQTEDENLSGITIFGYNVDILVTGSVLLVGAVFEFGQFLLLLCSDWAKVTLICCYIQQYSTFQRFETPLRFICGRQLFKPWERVLGQYSLLESFDHDPDVVRYNSFTSAFMDIPRKGQKESDRIELHDKVKKAVWFFVKQSHSRKLTNGLSSLREKSDRWLVINGIQVPGNILDWACKHESTAHVILVWHIATSLCEIHQALNPDSEWEKVPRDDFIVAISLSKYCAYLVAFCPKLLPGQAHSTECIFDQVVSQARLVLERRDTLTIRYVKMRRLGLGEHILIRGATLANLLIGMEDRDERWSILASFWAEMTTFVAISDDATAHAEHLAKGGEFVTHLWALLYHAGAAKQDWTEMAV